MKNLIYFAIFTSFFGGRMFNFPVGPVQMTLFRAAIILLAAGFLFMVLGREKLYLTTTRNSTYSIYFFIFLFFYALITILWAIDYGAWVKAVYFLGIGMFTTIIFPIILRKQVHFHHAFSAFRFGLVLQCAIGWYEIVTRQYHYVQLETAMRYSALPNRMPIAMCINPNDFATLMLFGVFVCYACMKADKSRLGKLIDGLLSINCIALLISTQSRANLIGLCMALIYVLWQSKYRDHLLLGVICALLILPFVWNQLIMCLTEISSGNDGSNSIRVNLILNGLSFLQQTFGFGVGAGQVEPWMLQSSVYPTNGMTNIHNWWVELLTSYGVILFLGYIFFYCKLFLGLHHSQHREMDPVRRAQSLCIAACMVGFTVGSISSSSNISTEWLWCFWAIAIAYQQSTGKNNLDQYMQNFYSARIVCPLYALGLLQNTDMTECLPE